MIKLLNPNFNHLSYMSYLKTDYNQGNRLIYIIVISLNLRCFKLIIFLFLYQFDSFLPLLIIIYKKSYFSLSTHFIHD